MSVQTFCGVRAQCWVKNPEHPEQIILNIKTLPKALFLEQNQKVKGHLKLGHTIATEPSVTRI